MGSPSKGSKDVKQSSLITKILTCTEDTEWHEADIMDILHWFKQLSGLILGLIAGAVPILGLPGVIIFFAVSSLFTVAFYKSFLKIDENDFGGHSRLLGEAMPFAFGVFLLTWIFTYNIVHL